MGMKPEDFFEAFVRGNYEDFRQHPGCLRRAFNAAVSASHLADHLYEYSKVHEPAKMAQFRGIPDYVDQLAESTGSCFRNIRSIANAYKHLYTAKARDKGVHSSVSSAGVIESIRWDDENAELREAKPDGFKDSKDGDLKEKVVFTTKDGIQLDFLPELEAVIKYWEKEFDRGVE